MLRLLVFALCLGLGCSSTSSGNNGDVGMSGNNGDVGMDTGDDNAEVDSGVDAAIDTHDSGDLGSDTNADAGNGPFSAAAMQSASEYSASFGGIGVLIWHDGEIIFEDYANGGNAQSAPHIYSATKAFWAVGLAAAMQDGLITDLDEPVSNTITEWQDELIHPGKSAITLRQIVNLSSGLSQDFMAISFIPSVDDVFQYVVDELTMVSLPGRRFSYGPAHYYVFGVVLDRKLKAIGFDDGPLNWLRGRVLDRIGITYDDWLHERAGNPHIPNGAFITARELVKLGIFLLHRGSWDGEQIIEAEGIEDLLVADGPNAGHGRFIWLNHPEGQGAFAADKSPPGSAGGYIYNGGAPEIFAGLGAGRNAFYVLPTQGAVVVRLTPTFDAGFTDTEFLSRLLGQ